jgi:hypothetical protein
MRSGRRRKGGFMRVQDGTTLAPFHPGDDGEVGRYFGGTQEVLGPETRFAV